MRWVMFVGDCTIYDLCFVKDLVRPLVVGGWVPGPAVKYVLFCKK